MFKPNMATTKMITVKVVPDTGVEDSEDFTVTLSNASGGYSVGRETGTGTIIMTRARRVRPSPSLVRPAAKATRPPRATSSATRCRSVTRPQLTPR